MANYIKSNGQIIDTKDMPDKYLNHALEKAIETNNQNNIDVLQAELDSRTTNQS